MNEKETSQPEAKPRQRSAKKRNRLAFASLGKPTPVIDWHRENAKRDSANNCYVV